MESDLGNLWELMGTHEFFGKLMGTMSFRAGGDGNSVRTRCHVCGPAAGTAAKAAGRLERVRKSPVDLTPIFCRQCAVGRPP